MAKPLDAHRIGCSVDEGFEVHLPLCCAMQKRAWTRECGPGRAGQGRAGQGKAGQGRAGQGRLKQAKAGSTTEQTDVSCMVSREHTRAGEEGLAGADWSCP